MTTSRGVLLLHLVLLVWDFAVGHPYGLGIPQLLTRCCTYVKLVNLSIFLVNITFALSKVLCCTAWHDWIQWARAFHSRQWGNVCCHLCVVFLYCDFSVFCLQQLLAWLPAGYTFNIQLMHKLILQYFAHLWQMHRSRWNLVWKRVWLMHCKVVVFNSSTVNFMNSHHITALGEHLFWDSYKIVQLCGQL